MSCPRAAPGPFYTLDLACLLCAAPQHAARCLIDFHEAAACKHCFFKKQPETPEELEEALDAMAASCIDGLRYRGTDPAILARLKAMGLSRLCDFPAR